MTSVSRMIALMAVLTLPGLALAAPPPPSTPLLPVDKGPVSVDADVTSGHVAAYLDPSKGPEVFYVRFSEVKGAGFGGAWTVGTSYNGRDADSDGTSIVWIIPPSDDVAYVSTGGGLANKFASDGGRPSVDNGLVAWDSVGFDSVLTWDRVFNPGNGGQIDLTASKIFLQTPSALRPPGWDSVIFSRFWTGVDYGVALVDPDNQIYDFIIKSGMLSNGLESELAFVPHAANFRVTWVGDHQIFVREWDPNVGNTYENFQRGKDFVLQNLPACQEYFYPRVGGPKGQFVLWTGNGCDDGDQVLYLTDTKSMTTYFVDFVGGSRVIKDWEYSVPYDIDQDVIAYVGKGNSSDDVYLVDIDMTKF